MTRSRSLHTRPTRRRAFRALPVAVIGIAGLAAAPLASAAWARPNDGPSPINQLPGQEALNVSAASVNGVPYVAWREFDGTNYEVRVAQLTPSGWQKVGQGINPASPINNDSLTSAKSVALADVGGVPHVAWTEGDGTNDEVRVARLNAAGTGWDKVGQVANPASPINVSPTRDAAGVAIANVGGVPYVAWTEQDGKNAEMHVARPTADGTGWDRVGIALKPGSPVNRADDRSARHAAIASVGGVPVVAWSEFDGVNYEIRAARLNATGTGWDPLGVALRPGSPINYDLKQNAGNPSIADIGGVPYVAWSEAFAGGPKVRVARLSTGGQGWEKVGAVLAPARPIADGNLGATAPSIAVIGGRPWVAWAESDGQNREVRVARMNLPGTGWDQLVAGASPINASGSANADAPSLTSVGDVPYVAWTERDDINREVRAARLEPDLLTLTASATDSTVQMSATVRTYDLPYQVGFVVDGPGGPRTTTAGPVSGDPATPTAVVNGLDPAAQYTARLYAVMGANGLTASANPVTVSTASVLPLRVHAVRSVIGARVGALKAIRVRSSTSGTAIIRVRSRTKVVRTMRVKVRTGVNVLMVRMPAVAGSYRVHVRVDALGGRRATTIIGVRLLPKKPVVRAR